MELVDWEITVLEGEWEGTKHERSLRLLRDGLRGFLG